MHFTLISPHRTACHATHLFCSFPQRDADHLRRYREDLHQQSSSQSSSRPQSKSQRPNQQQNRARSKSPAKNYQSSYDRQRSPRDRGQSFRDDDATRVYSACLICLGRHKHQVNSCTATMLWDGKTRARCKRERNGRSILNPAGQVLCGDWQRSRSCSGTGHIHECSGCGKLDHGAQSCPLADRK